MLVAQKVSRRSFLQGWTPGLVLGVLFYLCSILSLYIAGIDLVPCAFQGLAGIPCPLCGGTRASFLLFSGHPLSAFRINPLVCIALVLSLTWFISWIVLGLRVRFQLSDRYFAVGLLTILFLNWIYVLLTLP